MTKSIGKARKGNGANSAAVEVRNGVANYLAGQDKIGTATQQIAHGILVMVAGGETSVIWKAASNTANKAYGETRGKLILLTLGDKPTYTKDQRQAMAQKIAAESKIRARQEKAITDGFEVAICLVLAGFDHNAFDKSKNMFRVTVGSLASKEHAPSRPDFDHLLDGKFVYTCENKSGKGMGKIAFSLAALKAKFIQRKAGGTSREGSPDAKTSAVAKLATNPDLLIDGVSAMIAAFETNVATLSEADMSSLVVLRDRIVAAHNRIASKRNKIMKARAESDAAKGDTSTLSPAGKPVPKPEPERQSA